MEKIQTLLINVIYFFFFEIPDLNPIHVVDESSVLTFETFTIVYIYIPVKVVKTINVIIL